MICSCARSQYRDLTLSPYTTWFVGININHWSAIYFHQNCPTMKNFNIPLILSNLINQATCVCGMHLIHRSKSDHYHNHWSTWPLPLFAYFNPEFLGVGSIGRIVFDRGSISTHILSTWSFHPLTNSTNRKTSFAQACSIYRLLQRHWS